MCLALCWADQTLLSEFWFKCNPCCHECKVSSSPTNIYSKSLTNFGWTNKQTEWTHIGKQEKLWKAGWKYKHVWFNQAPLRKLKLMPTWVQGTWCFVCSSQYYTYDLTTTWGNLAFLNSWISITIKENQSKVKESWTRLWSYHKNFCSQRFSMEKWEFKHEF